MQFSNKRNFTRWFIIFSSFIFIVFILWNTYSFFQIFKNEERLKMEYWAEAQKTIINSDINTEIALPIKIIEDNKTIPILLTDSKDSIIGYNNIDEKLMSIPKEAKVILKKLKKENEPIKFEYIPGKFRYIYYGNSDRLNNLIYFPIAFLLIILLFALLVYNFYRSTKMATENKLWAGMAKETAHQIGTPLSSLIGWLEILKAENVSDTTVAEIEKDIDRLQNITDRFSKIGSEPILVTKNIVSETENSFQYLQSRFSKQVEFSFKAPDFPIMVSLNPILFSWSIENLVKNAIDAMKGKGKLSVAISLEGELVKINVTDSGNGIPKKQFKKIFEPGFTTKKRGWGLGLSLTKRIVEEYHNGKIKVLNSEVNKGTTFQISFKKI
jgi:two-component system, sporulation sensor kinase D